MLPARWLPRSTLVVPSDLEDHNPNTNPPIVGSKAKTDNYAVLSGLLLTSSLDPSKQCKDPLLHNSLGRHRLSKRL